MVTFCTTVLSLCTCTVFLPPTGMPPQHGMRVVRGQRWGRLHPPGRQTHQARRPWKEVRWCLSGMKSYKGFVIMKCYNSFCCRICGSSILVLKGRVSFRRGGGGGRGRLRRSTFGGVSTRHTFAADSLAVVVVVGPSGGQMITCPRLK